MLQPTIVQYLAWLRGQGVKVEYLPDNSAYIAYSFNISLNTVNGDFAKVPNANSALFSIYSLMVFNLGMDLLINNCPDQTNQTFFEDLRKTFKIGNFVAGVVQSTNDEGTGVGLLVPEAFAGLTVDQLENLKTPYGRRYLGWAQKYGPSIWGMS